MRFGLLFELGIPRGTGPTEAALLPETLEQIELADRLGFDYLWQGERGFGDEQGAAVPGVLLAAASQRTGRIRIGWGIAAAADPQAIATLDLISDGRVELGFGAREGWEGSLAALARTLAGESAGVSSVRPEQDPHPPLWAACGDAASVAAAARKGVGALSFALSEPEAAGESIAEYYRLLLSEQCRPAGFDWNPNVAVVIPLMREAAPARDLVARYESVGADQVIFVIEIGRDNHDRVCEALELLATEVMPEYAEVAGELDDSKEAKLEDARERALARGPRRRLTGSPPVRRADDRRSTGLAASIASRLRTRASRRRR